MVPGSGRVVDLRGFDPSSCRLLVLDVDVAFHRRSRVGCAFLAQVRVVVYSGIAQAKESSVGPRIAASPRPSHRPSYETGPVPEPPTPVSQTSSRHPAQTYKTDCEIENFLHLGRHLALRELDWISRPLHVEFSLNHRCNLRCITCPQSVPGMMSMHEMSRVDASRILDEVLPQASLITPSAGSEPLLGDLEFVVRKAREHQVLVHLISNGTLLSPERFEEFADHVWRVDFSVDSHDAKTFEDLRPPARFAQVAAHVRGTVAAAHARGIPTVFVLVLSERNVDTLPEYVRWVASIGGRAVRILELLDNTPACADLQVLAHRTPEELQSVLHETAVVAEQECVDLEVSLPAPFGFVRLHREPIVRLNGADILGMFQRHLFGQYPRFCDQAATYLRIDPRGNVYPCCRSGRELWMGNLLESSFDTIWNGPSYRKLRLEHHHGQLNPTCSACTLLQYPKPERP